MIPRALILSGLLLLTACGGDPALRLQESQIAARIATANALPTSTPTATLSPGGASASGGVPIGATATPTPTRQQRDDADRTANLRAAFIEWGATQKTYAESWHHFLRDVQVHGDTVVMLLARESNGRPITSTHLANACASMAFTLNARERHAWRIRNTHLIDPDGAWLHPDGPAFCARID